MELRDIFLIFGLCLAAMAVIVAFVGLRSKDFPSRGTQRGLLALAVLLVVGTATFAVKLSVEEAHDRDSKAKEVVGEKASVAPLNISDYS